MVGLKRSGKYDNPFLIKISGLTQGVFEYHFCLDALEFYDQEISDKTFPNKIEVDINLHKSSSEIVAEILVHAIAVLECDLCLRPVSQNVQGRYKVYFLFESSGGKDECEDDVRILDPAASEIDLLEDVRDTLLLGIPLKNVCRDEEACSAYLSENQSASYIAESDEKSQLKDDDSDWQKALKEIEIKLKTN